MHGEEEGRRQRSDLTNVFHIFAVTYAVLGSSAGRVLHSLHTRDQIFFSELAPRTKQQMRELPGRIRLHTSTVPNIQTRGSALGISIERLHRSDFEHNDKIPK